MASSAVRQDLVVSPQKDKFLVDPQNGQLGKGREKEKGVITD